jgi:hypothetical protein
VSAGHIRHSQIFAIKVGAYPSGESYRTSCLRVEVTDSDNVTRKKYYSNNYLYTILYSTGPRYLKGRPYEEDHTLRVDS